MPTVSIPARLRKLLKKSPLATATTGLADAAGDILASNAVPFFPAYTDHGTHHVERVLEAAVQLVPEEVWERKLLKAPDAAVLSCACMLHDLAMHVEEGGFVELIAPGTRFQPLGWFSQARVGRPGDLPWPELWAEFQREARHFGTSQLELIVGSAGTVPSAAYDVKPHPDRWTKADRLLIGEFLRRHHARLSHEIALYGFPGARHDTFPVLAETAPAVANAIGVVARSHGESLRTMLDYLEYLEPGSKRPSGALLPFHMGLLRVADYLQIEADRAPPLLLRLHAPQSPLSIEEWNKHGAITAVVWDHEDPGAISVTVSPSHGLRTHLALGDLFRGLQHEMDTTTAVLAEEYGAKAPLDALKLARQRVRSNLDEPSLHEQLPYLPRRAALRSDADLFRLVVRDLYGNQPAVAGRELVQNAADAVRARRAWEQDHPGIALDLREMESDIEVTIEQVDDTRHLLRVADRGIGMTPELVVDYFLKAGASFGPTDEEIDELDSATAIRRMKAGRFGIGAFAAFLLGREMQVVTRRAGADRGIRFRARIDEELVRIDWDDGPVGTEVTVPFDLSVLPESQWRHQEPHERLESFVSALRSFYRLADPAIRYVWRTPTSEDVSGGPADVPAAHQRLPDRWRRERAIGGTDMVLWRIADPWQLRGDPAEFGSGYEDRFAHNGILIQPLDDPSEPAIYRWSDRDLEERLMTPDIAVFDSRHALPVALHRYGLVDPILPFEADLLRSIGRDLVAFTLASGAPGHPLLSGFSRYRVVTRTTTMPFLRTLIARYVRGPLLILWHLALHTRDRRLTQEQLSPDDLPWRAPFRHRIEARWSQTGDEYEMFDAVGWDGVAPRIGDHIGKVGEALQAAEVASVLVKGGDQGGYEVWRHAPTRLPDHPWRGLHRDQTPQTEVEHALLAAAATLGAQAPQAPFVLSAYSGFGDVSPPHQHLAEAWCDVIGGGLERRPRKVGTSIEAILDANKKLRPAVARWRRINEEDSQAGRPRW